jgi:hypothetical protein
MLKLKNLLILFFLIEIKTEKLPNYITDISFSIDSKNNGCYNTLKGNGYGLIQGDIRQGAGGKVCTLGVKRFFETNKEAITNIIGTVSGSNQPQKIKEDGIEYTLITDNRNNGDIHKGSGGNYLHLYYTKDKRAGKNITDISVGSFNHAFRQDFDMEVVNHSKNSKGYGALDLNSGRGGPYNYIFIFRS